MRIAAVLCLIAPLSACQNVSKLDLSRPGGRAMWQRPDDVIAALALQAGDRVADIGAGEGYFVPYLAEAVAPGGLVFAVDVDPDIVAELESRFAGTAGVRAVLGEYHDPTLPDASIDLVLLVNTYHHIEDRADYFARLQRDLSDAGRVVIVEPDRELGGILGWYVDDEHASDLAGVRAEMARAGYREQALHDFLPVQFMVVFQPE